MAKLSRVFQKLFANTAGADEIGKFGSFAAGTPQSTTNIADMMSYGAWNGGWLSAILGNNSPCIEDMNAVCAVFAYQLAYIFQAGTSEWNTDTIYYINSFAQSSGIIYQSIADDNQGNAVTDPTKWKFFAAARKTPTITKYLTGSGTYTVPAGVKALRVRGVGGGGAGGGSGGGGNGAAGGNTTFGTALLIANGGNGGAGTGSFTAGGSASIAAPAYGSIFVGGQGQGSGISSSANGGAPTGGQGGGAMFGGGGGGAFGLAAGGAPAANSGAGGGGASTNSGNSMVSGAGGGGGGGFDAIVPDVTAGGTYGYAIGSPSAGGTAGVSGAIGGAGAEGYLEITEFYN